MKDYVKQLKESLDKMTPDEQKALDEKTRKSVECKLTVDEYLEMIGYKEK